MKRKYLLLIPILLYLAACTPPAVANEAIYSSNAVQVSEALKVAINGLLLTVVMFGLQFVFDLIRLDLRGLGTIIAATLSEAVILQLQGVIDVINSAYDPFISIGLEILLAVLIFFGAVRMLFQRGRAVQLIQPRE